MYLANRGQRSYETSRKGYFMTLKPFLLIPMPHGSLALTKGIMDYCVASSLKIRLFTQYLNQLVSEQQIGNNTLLRKFLGFRTPQEALLNEIKS